LFILLLLHFQQDAHKKRTYIEKNNVFFIDNKFVRFRILFYNQRNND
jgi:hypothetical protein